MAILAKTLIIHQKNQEMKEHQLEPMSFLSSQKDIQLSACWGTPYLPTMPLANENRSPCITFTLTSSLIKYYLF
jgi:hypothetical protein